MKRYLIVFITASGDPGTDYTWGDTMFAALEVWQAQYTRGGAPDVLSVVKVKG